MQAFPALPRRQRCHHCARELHDDVSALITLLSTRPLRASAAAEWAELGEYVARTIAYAYELQLCTQCSQELRDIATALEFSAMMLLESHAMERLAIIGKAG